MQALTENELELRFGDGYNSDGQSAPPCIGETPDEYFEKEVPSVDDSAEGTPVSENGSTTEPTVVIIENDVIMKLKVDVLKDELKKRALRNKGLKKELQEILLKAMVDRSPLVPESSEEAAQPTVFAAGVKW